MRALYETPPSAAELAAYGLVLDDLDSAEFGVWPDNLPAVNVLVAMNTQWRTGYGGATGLDYNVLPSVFSLVGIPRGDWPDTFECVRVLESEALKVMSEKD